MNTVCGQLRRGTKKKNSMVGVIRVLLLTVSGAVFGTLSQQLVGAWGGGQSCRGPRQCGICWVGHLLLEGNSEPRTGAAVGAGPFDGRSAEIAGVLLLYPGSALRCTRCPQ